VNSVTAATPAGAHRSRLTLSCEPGSRPHVLLLGGQDAPNAEQLKRRWVTRIAALLPAHRLTILAWPRSPLTAAWPELEQLDIEPALVWTTSAPSSRRALWPALDAGLAACASGCVAWLDERMRFDPRGKTADPLSWIVDRFTHFSTAALYDRDGFGSRLCERTANVLTTQRIDLVVAHSFGGTIALRTAWQLAQAGVPDQFRLITLGTASGPTVVRSRMFQGLPRCRGKVALAPCIARWQHCVSASDGFVGQASLPHGFDRVEIVRVQTGAFVAPGRGHALSAYLATPEVLQAIRAGLRPVAASTAAPPASAGLSVMAPA
jgi:hypothetical protein